MVRSEGPGEESGTSGYKFRRKRFKIQRRVTVMKEEGVSGLGTKRIVKECCRLRRVH